MPRMLGIVLLILALVITLAWGTSLWREVVQITYQRLGYFYPPTMYRMVERAQIALWLFIAVLVSRSGLNLLRHHSYPRGINTSFFLGACALSFGYPVLARLDFVISDRPLDRPRFYLPALCSPAMGAPWLNRHISYPLLIAFVVSGAVLISVLVYRMWAAIDDGHARLSPAKAVVVMFVPFINLYWWFHVFWGFARDYNTYVRRHSLELPELKPIWFLTLSVGIVLSLMPFIGAYLAVPNTVLFLICVYTICNCINALAQERRDSEANSSRVSEQP